MQAGLLGARIGKGGFLHFEGEDDYFALVWRHWMRSVGRPRDPSWTPGLDVGPDVQSEHGGRSVMVARERIMAPCRFLEQMGRHPLLEEQRACILLHAFLIHHPSYHCYSDHFGGLIC